MWSPLLSVRKAGASLHWIVCLFWLTWTASYDNKSLYLVLWALVINDYFFDTSDMFVLFLKRKRKQFTKAVCAVVDVYSVSLPWSAHYLIFHRQPRRTQSWWQPLFPLSVRIWSTVSLSPVRLPRMLVFTFGTLYIKWPVHRLILLLAFRIMCVICLSEGTFLFLCVNFCFPVLCHLWSTLLLHGPQEERSRKCTPEAVLSSPQLWGTRHHSSPADAV